MREFLVRVNVVPIVAHDGAHIARGASDPTEFMGNVDVVRKCPLLERHRFARLVLRAGLGLESVAGARHSVHSSEKKCLEEAAHHDRRGKMGMRAKTSLRFGPPAFEYLAHLRICDEWCKIRRSDAAGCCGRGPQQL